MSEAIARFGRLDHLDCNAGIDIIKPAVEHTPDEWDRVLAVNSAASSSRPSGSPPLDRAGSRWFDHDDLSHRWFGRHPDPSVPTRRAGAASNQLVRTLAAAWAAAGIRVNAVAPGYVANIMDSVTVHGDPVSDRRIGTFTPLGRRATLEEVAAPYAFLASPAGSYVTGPVLAVDGGYSAT